MSRRPPMPRALLLAGAILAAAASARAPASDGPTCPGTGDFHGRTDLSAARIAGPARRVPFVKDALGAKGCPSAAGACRSASYLVPGDAVVAQPARDGFACVVFVGRDGDDHAGLVPAAAVAPEAAAPADWAGTWLRTEAKIVVAPAPGGRLRLRGDATYGALDPDRVKRGAVNLGAFEAVAAPDGAGRLAFDVGDKATLPVDGGDEGDCKLWLRRLGPYLLVDDNRNCGGMNVTFGGIYRRKG